MSYVLRRSQILTAAFLALTPVVPIHAQETPEQWTVIYVGEVGLEEVTRFYSEQIKTDFGVDVFYTQRNAGAAPHASKFLASGAWNVVGDAQVVVVGIEFVNDRPGFCTDQPGDQPIKWALDEVPAMVDQFLESLAEVADPTTQIIRIANEAVLPGHLARWKEDGVVAECMHAVKSFNDAWASGAGKYGFTLVDFFDVWNGPDGTAQPPSSFYKEDGVRLSSEGAKAAAELILSVGYQPLEP